MRARIARTRARTCRTARQDLAEDGWIQGEAGGTKEKPGVAQNIAGRSATAWVAGVDFGRFLFGGGDVLVFVARQGEL